MQSPRIHYLPILGSLGLLLHVPGIMSLLTLVVVFVFGEYYALYPFLITGVTTILIAQIVYRLFYNGDECHLWDAMIVAAISWLICPLVAAIPFYCSLSLYITGIDPLQSVILYHTPINVIFECFSGFTGTGLSLISEPQFFPHTILWWRSFMQWVGGIGLIVFMLSLVQTTRRSYTLYYAEARSEKLVLTVGQTSRLIWGIYLAYTLVAIALMWLSSSSIWEAINHAMTAISTGGFTIVENAFYSANVKNQCSTMFVMFIGAISFSMHYEIILSTSLRVFWKDLEHRWFLITLIFGVVFVHFFDMWHLEELTFMQTAFQWFSALATCGFHSVDMELIAAPTKIFFIAAMLVGGCVGSTAGGLKFERFVNVIQAMSSRFKLVFSKKETDDLDKFSGQSPESEAPEIIEHYSKKTEKLYAANVLFTLWIFTLIIGWVLILKFSPNVTPINCLFEVVSAMSNVGLTTGAVHLDLPAAPKIVYILLMWLGRLEIVPAVILFLAIPVTKSE